jgi:hypothetical protein
MIPHSARSRQQTLSSVRNPVDSSSWARIYGLNLSSSRSQEPSMTPQSTQLHSTGSTFLSSTSNGQSPPAGRQPQPRSANPERVLSRSSVLLTVASFGWPFEFGAPGGNNSVGDTEQRVSLAPPTPPPQIHRPLQQLLRPPLQQHQRPSCRPDNPGHRLHRPANTPGSTSLIDTAPQISLASYCFNPSTEAIERHLIRWAGPGQAAHAHPDQLHGAEY